MNIVRNLSEVRLKIARAAAASGRDPTSIKLLAVSKTMPPQVILAAYQGGQRAFAENRVQEWVEKAPALPGDCEWHIVGRLQTNKVKYLDERIVLIHSLDRFNLLETLENYGSRRDQIWHTLVQVNVARDPAKAGVNPEELADFLAVIKDHPHVRVLGLMTIGPLEATPDETREFFRTLRILRDTLAKKEFPNVDLRELSMGMSQDYEIAIEEGATIVRVGRQIFGERA